MEKMLEEVECCKKKKYKHFNEDMIPTKDDEQNFKNADVIFVIKIFCKRHSCKRSLSHNWEAQRISSTRL